MGDNNTKHIVNQPSSNSESDEEDNNISCNENDCNNIFKNTINIDEDAEQNQNKKDMKTDDDEDDDDQPFSESSIISYLFQCKKESSVDIDATQSFEENSKDELDLDKDLPRPITCEIQNIKKEVECEEIPECGQTCENEEIVIRNTEMDDDLNESSENVLSEHNYMKFNGNVPILKPIEINIHDKDDLKVYLRSIQEIINSRQNAHCEEFIDTEIVELSKNITDSLQNYGIKKELQDQENSINTNQKLADLLQECGIQSEENTREGTDVRELPSENDQNKKEDIQESTDAAVEKEEEERDESLIETQVEEMNIDNNIDCENIEKARKQSTEENLSIIFSQTRSEPLEYEQNTEVETDIQNYEVEVLTQLETNNTLPPDTSNLKLFAKEFYEECEKYLPQKQEELDEFILKKINELKKLSPLLLINKANLNHVEVQTEISGDEMFKERRRKINEKSKRHLLKKLSDSSSSASDSSSDTESNDDNSCSETENNLERKCEIDFDSPPFSPVTAKNQKSIVDTDESNFENSANNKTNIDETPTQESESGTEPYQVGGINLSECIVSKDKLINSSSASFYGMHDSDDDDNGNSKDLGEKILTNGEIISDEESYQKVDISNDIKLKMKPVVVVEKLCEDEIEDFIANYLDEQHEKDVQRLTDLISLEKDRKSTFNQKSSSHKKDNKKTNDKIDKISNILNGVDEDHEFSSDESNIDKEEVITERQYLEKCNINLKQQFLKSSSSESESEDDNILSDLDDNDDDDDDDDDDEDGDKNLNDSSSSSSSLVSKFLKKMQDKQTKEPDLEDNDNIDADEGSSHPVLQKNEIKLSLECEENKKEVKDEELSVKSRKSSEDKRTNKDDDNDDDDDDDDNGSISSRVCDRIYDSTRKILKEKELDLDSLTSDKKRQRDSDSDDSSDCEILDENIQHTKKRKTQPKTVETLLAEAAKRKSYQKHNDAELISLSSSNSDSELVEEVPVKEDEEARKRFSKPMLRQDQLAGETKLAQKQENERMKRLQKKQQMLKDVIEKYKKNDTDTGGSGQINFDSDLILDYIAESKTFIKVHREIVRQLKPHQVEGIKFMYDTCYGSVKHLKNYPGSGCILAHCMGLGKTLQLIALLHTVASYKELNTTKILILCPKSTIMNWSDEITRWLAPAQPNTIRTFYFSEPSDIENKLRTLKAWSEYGTKSSKYSSNDKVRKAGVLLLGYEAFRILVFYHCYKKKGLMSDRQREIVRDEIEKLLLNPGADLVICDEGHIIKNRKAAISEAVVQIRTPRRIILTGTPIQNNLKEYYSMVNFIKPSFLGTDKEFANLYANPIKNGQHKDSSKIEIKIMKQRSFVLHKKLSNFVQRREAALLKTFLPEKYEYVLFIPMTEIQNSLYDYFLQAISNRPGSKGKSLIPDYTCLRKIWTHPKVLEVAWKAAKEKKKDQPPKTPPTVNLNSDDERPDDDLDHIRGELSVTNDWWRPLLKNEDLETILPSNKIRLMFEILQMCEESNEKCLIFSAFVAVLNVVEYFMQQNKSWVANKDYFRLDGKTSKHIRHQMVQEFNDPANTRTRCFLISAKAGGQGINLIGANRVIIIDTSWNPSNDQQNIFRIFRLGQKRKCYVYRLLSMGTMEEKVYSRSVTKQAMSFRVVDEQQIDRHYSMAELTELYTLTKPNFDERPLPIFPQDHILASLLRNHPELIYKYHEHDSLLENKEEQELSEQEKADAWAQYERDLQFSQEPNFINSESQGMPYNFATSGYNPAYNGMSPYWPNLNYPGQGANALYSLYNLSNMPNLQNLQNYGYLGRSNPAASLSAYQSSLFDSTSFMQPPQSGNIIPPNASNLPISNLAAAAALNALNASAQSNFNSSLSSLNNYTSAASSLNNYTSSTPPINAASLSGLFPSVPGPTGSSSSPPMNPQAFFANLRKYADINNDMLGSFANTSPMRSSSSSPHSASASNALPPISSAFPSMQTSLAPSMSTSYSTSSSSSSTPSPSISTARASTTATSHPSIAPISHQSPYSPPATSSRNQQQSSRQLNSNVSYNTPATLNKPSTPQVSVSTVKSTTDGILANVIRKPSSSSTTSSPTSTGLNLTTKTTNILRNNETELLPLPVSKNTSNTPRQTNMGIAYFNNNSDGSTSNSRNMSAMTITPTNVQKPSANISIRSVNSINNDGATSSTNTTPRTSLSSTANNVRSNQQQQQQQKQITNKNIISTLTPANIKAIAAEAAAAKQRSMSNIKQNDNSTSRQSTVPQLTPVMLTKTVAGGGGGGDKTTTQRSSPSVSVTNGAKNMPPLISVSSQKSKMLPNIQNRTSSPATVITSNKSTIGYKQQQLQQQSNKTLLSKNQKLIGEKNKLPPQNQQQSIRTITTANKNTVTKIVPVSTVTNSNNSSSIPSSTTSAPSILSTLNKMPDNLLDKNALDTLSNRLDISIRPVESSTSKSGTLNTSQKKATTVTSQNINANNNNSNSKKIPTNAVTLIKRPITGQKRPASNMVMIPSENTAKKARMIQRIDLTSSPQKGIKTNPNTTQKVVNEGTS